MTSTERRSGGPGEHRPYHDPTDRNRPGRPNLTSEAELQGVALQLFRRRGFHDVTVEELARAAGISRRTFNRYFASKADVLWYDFDRELEELTLALEATSPAMGLWDAIAEAVVKVSQHQLHEQDDARLRFELILTEPQVRAAADQRYDAWEQTISGFVADRFPGADQLTTRTVGRVALAACRTAFEQWLDQPDRDLTAHLEAAIGLLADGFSHLEPDRRGDRHSRADPDPDHQAEPDNQTDPEKQADPDPPHRGAIR